MVHLKKGLCLLMDVFVLFKHYLQIKEKLPYLEKGLCLLGDVFMELPVLSWPIPLGVPCIWYIRNLMGWFINILISSLNFIMLKFVLIFILSINPVFYIPISILRQGLYLNLENFAFNGKSKSRGDQFNPECIWYQFAFYSLFISPFEMI